MRSTLLIGLAISSLMATAGCEPVSSVNSSIAENQVGESPEVQITNLTVQLQESQNQVADQTMKIKQLEADNQQLQNNNDALSEKIDSINEKILVAVEKANAATQALTEVGKSLAEASPSSPEADTKPIDDSIDQQN